MSVFEGWLSFGGNEIVNNERTWGIARTAPCPMGWFKGARCDSLQDALGQDGEYVWSNIAAAPWYDPDIPQSADFYGLWAYSITEVLDSTRTVPATEGITDGGVLGLTRRTMKTMRVRGLLAGRGRSAIEYGQVWLSAALDPGACGQHGTECGLTDVEWLVDCPPARAMVPELTEWEPQETNLATNPSFETTTGATVEVRRNLATRPVPPTGTGGWGTNNASLYPHTLDTSFTHTPGVPSMRADRQPVTPNVTLLSAFAVGMATPTAGATVAPGDTITYSLWMASSEPNSRWTLTLSWWDAAGVQITPATTNASGDTTNPALTWFRASVTGTAPAGAVTARMSATLLLPVGQASVGGEQAWIADALVETGDEIRDWFSGASVSPDPDLIPSFTGAANASQSILSGRVMSGITASNTQRIFWQASDGDDKILRYRVVSPGAIGLQVTGASVPPGVQTVLFRVRPMTRDFVAAPRIMGVASGAATYPVGVWTEVRLTLPAPGGSGAVTGTGFFVAAGAGHQPGDIIDIADVVLVAGEYDGPFFDGDTISGDPEIERFSWLGTPNASASLRETRERVERPQTDEEYAEDVDLGRRYLHDVAAISGPLITATYSSGDFWAYDVEFTLKAERPWIYSVTRQIDLPPTVPVIVQDTPFNLIPFPSAELADDDLVVVATNYSTNPSVETNTVGWASSANAAVSTAGAVTLARSTEIAAVGVASAMVEFTASAAGGDGELRVQQAVDLAAPAGSRYSANLWATTFVMAGAAEVDRIDFDLVWRDASNAELSPPVALGSVAPTGGVVSAHGLLPPVGAVSAVVRAQAILSSWSSGARVRVHGDALALTVP